MSIEKILGPVRDYAWGTPGGIDRVRGMTPSDTVQAEWWLGDHPQGEAQLVRTGESVTHWLNTHGQDSLGFLLKVLTPSSPLSLQVHPTTRQAEEGFAREEAAGVPLDHPRRVFRDRSAKPEVVVCLTGEFDALAGNAPDEVVLNRIATLEEAGYPAELARGWRDRLASGRAETVAWLLGDDQTAKATVEGLGPVSAADPLLDLLWSHYPGDPGCAVGMMLNRALLQPGEALFLDAGSPHAYLHGVAVELMAPSDNVLRGGLTPKHIDIAQLLDIASFDPSDPPRLEPIRHSTGWWEYRPPGQGFALHRVETDSPSDLSLQLTLPAIALSVGQGAQLEVSGQTLDLGCGEAAVIADPSAHAEIRVGAGSDVWIAHRR